MGGHSLSACPVAQLEHKLRKGPGSCTKTTRPQKRAERHSSPCPYTSSCQFSRNQTIWSTMPSREDRSVGCSSRCMCMIRLQRHMGAVALMGPGSDAEWDWLPTELGCCCPESESDTHNASVSANLAGAGARCSGGPAGQRNAGSCRRASTPETASQACTGEGLPLGSGVGDSGTGV